MIPHHVVRRAGKPVIKKAGLPQRVTFDVITGPVHAYTIDNGNKSWLNTFTDLKPKQSYNVPIVTIRNMENAEDQPWAVITVVNSRMGMPLEHLRRLHQAGRINLEENHDK